MRRTAHLASAFAILLVANCASDRYQPATTEWDSSSSPSSSSSSDASTAPAPVTAAAPKDKKLTAKEVAASVATGDACNALAQTHYAQDKKRGVGLIKACAGRDDFYTLRWLIAGPWRAEVAADVELQLAVAEVIARRGGFVEADTLACRQAGIPIYDLASAVEKAEQAVGKLVLARGAVEGAVVREKQAGGKSIQVATFAESSWADEAIDENLAPPPLVELQQKTGRYFFARVEPGEDRLVKKKQSVVALRFEERRDSGDDPSVLGALVGIWPAKRTLTIAE